MIRPRIIVVDYGLGNLFSVCKAFTAIGAEPVISGRPEDILQADGVVIPGVGAFGDGMQGLRKRDLVAPLRDFATGGRPVIGICLGMQLLMTESEEFGLHQGLDLVQGSVVSLRKNPLFRAKIPQVGWNGLHPARPWERTLFESLPPASEVYFVHSFGAVPKDPSVSLATIRYGGIDVCAAVQRGNVSGCQFHPEKSRDAGLHILRNFIASIEGTR